MKELYLTSYTHLSSGGFFKDDIILLPGNDDPSDLFKQAYQKLGFSYPKFFKMDPLSKLGILGTEPFFTDGKLKERYEDDEIAVVLGNRSSSMASDIAHLKNYTDGTASPAVFVYTLPNIVVGEICIRHELYSESNFYIFESFDAEELLAQARVLLAETKAKACVIGWVEYFEKDFNGMFFLLEEEGKTIATKEVLGEKFNH